MKVFGSWSGVGRQVVVSGVRWLWLGLWPFSVRAILMQEQPSFGEDAQTKPDEVRRSARRFVLLLDIGFLAVDRLPRRKLMLRF